MKNLHQLTLWLAMLGIATVAYGQTNLNFAQVLDRAQRGDEEAQFRLGRFYIDGYFNGGTNAFANVPDLMPDYTLAAKWLTPLAEKGHARAQNTLGSIFKNGLGCATNLSVARQWFERATEGGDYKAPRNLSEMYRDGRGLPADKTKANELLALSVDRLRVIVQRGDPDDEYNWGIAHFDGSTREMTINGLAWIYKAAGQGHPLAEYWLGRRLAQEPQSNSGNCVALVRSAADKGLILAQREMGRLFAFSDLSLRDDREAFRWYKLAADRGSMDGQHFVAVMYTHGKGVERDLTEAFKWMRKAAERGDTLSEFETGIRLRYGRGVEKNVEEAAVWLRKGADKGYARSQHRLADLYLTGSGVKKDRVEAYKLYSLAVEELGEKTAKERDELGAQLNKKQLAEAEKRIKAFQKELAQREKTTDKDR